MRHEKKSRTLQLMKQDKTFGSREPDILVTESQRLPFRSAITKQTDKEARRAKISHFTQIEKKRMFVYVHKMHEQYGQI